MDKEEKSLDNHTMISQKEITLQLKVISLTITVSELTKFYVLWSRGKKTAKTNDCIISDKITTATINETFQINTIMDVSADGKPIKSKMSNLVVFSSSVKDKILGKCELDLSKFGDNEQKIQKIQLVDCQSSDDFIEVGLKAGTMKKQRQMSVLLPAMGSHLLNSLTTSVTQQSDAFNENLLAIFQDVEKLTKEKAKFKKDFDKEISEYQGKINKLQTDVENAKQDCDYERNKVKDFEEKLVKQSEVREKQLKDIDLQDQEISKFKNLILQQQQLNAKIQLSIDESRQGIIDKEFTAQKIKEQKTTVSIENESFAVLENYHRLAHDQLLKGHDEKMPSMTKKIHSFYDIKRFDCNYLTDAVIFNQELAPANPDQTTR